jgi:hypothetical protein
LFVSSSSRFNLLLFGGEAEDFGEEEGLIRSYTSFALLSDGSIPRTIICWLAS